MRKQLQNLQIIRSYLLALTSSRNTSDFADPGSSLLLSYRIDDAIIIGGSGVDSTSVTADGNTLSSSTVLLEAQPRQISILLASQLIMTILEHLISI